MHTWKAVTELGGFFLRHEVVDDMHVGAIWGDLEGKTGSFRTGKLRDMERKRTHPPSYIWLKALRSKNPNPLTTFPANIDIVFLSSIDILC